MRRKLKRLIANKEVKNASWLIIGKIVQMLLSLVVGILSARYLGPSNYGLINYGAAYVTFFSSLCNLGINSVIIKEFIDNPNEEGVAIGSALGMRLFSSALSVLMILGIVSIVDKNEPLTIIVVFLCSIGLIFRIFEIFNYWFQSRYQSKVTAVITLIAYIVTSIYKIVLLILEKDVTWFAVATSIDYILVAILLYITYRRYNGQNLKWSKLKAKKILGSSYHYILSSMMVAIYGQTDKIMIKQMLSEEDVGYYAISMVICTLWTFVLQAIIDSMYPTILRLRENNIKSYEYKNKQLYAIVFYMACGVSLMFVLFGETIVRILYGDAYLPAVGALKTVTWYTAFAYLGVARNAWIISEGCQKYLKYMYGVAAIMNVALNALFIPLLGIVGAGLASLITQIFTSIILPLFFPKMRANSRLMIDAIMLKGIR